ncbi:prepilin peptidase [Aeromicrobium massiliense]|uniref:prepilin peptidase n=1 Tax=Aeromicrobium massiliense TaxID=1464554 RepID=UPI0002E5871D|nr:A24 family peptidase [Aeromicrobium massiliense]
MLVVLACLVAAALGWLAPRVLARVPEPDDAADGKPTYASLAAVPRLGVVLAVASALLTGVVGLVVEPEVVLVVWTLLVPAGLLLGYVDARTRLLPKRIVLPLNVAVLVLVGVAAALERDLDLLWRALAGGAGLFVLFAAFWFVAPRGLGYGDVRLSPALGMTLAASGWMELFVGVYAGFVLAAVLGLVLGRLGRIDPKQFAFGPYLVAGAVVGVLWQPLVLGG